MTIPLTCGAIYRVGDDMLTCYLPYDPDHRTHRYALSNPEKGFIEWAFHMPAQPIEPSHTYARETHPGEMRSCQDPRCQQLWLYTLPNS